MVDRVMCTLTMSRQMGAWVHHRFSFLTVFQSELDGVQAHRNRPRRRLPEFLLSLYLSKINFSTFSGQNNLVSVHRSDQQGTKVTEPFRVGNSLGACLKMAHFT
jgi:hypothetical protein